ncbi:hypothetical protein TNCT_104631 [Trichonephila clavata]|uniref:Uncharacterized protein n=1 Tax=Trichonephila clavata TaxID=2740835 RepID=A0A8X6KVN9_TRICU|nr:hypothetical protein TNCT_104631 [Trichonephila clavata]
MKEMPDCSSAGIFQPYKQKLFTSVHDHNVGLQITHSRRLLSHVIQKLIMKEMPDCSQQASFSLIRQKLFTSVHDHNVGLQITHSRRLLSHVIQKLIRKEMPGLLLSRHLSA